MSAVNSYVCQLACGRREPRPCLTPSAIPSTVAGDVTTACACAGLTAERRAMMPPSMRPGQSPRYGQASGANDAGEELGMRAEAVWRRLVDVERALGGQEGGVMG